MFVYGWLFKTFFIIYITHAIHYFKFWDSTNICTFAPNQSSKAATCNVSWHIFSSFTPSDCEMSTYQIYLRLKSNSVRKWGGGLCRVHIRVNIDLTSSKSVDTAPSNNYLRRMAGMVLCFRVHEFNVSRCIRSKWLRTKYYLYNFKTAQYESTCK